MPIAYNTRTHIRTKSGRLLGVGNNSMQADQNSTTMLG